MLLCVKDTGQFGPCFLLFLMDKLKCEVPDGNRLLKELLLCKGANKPEAWCLRSVLKF